MNAEPWKNYTPGKVRAMSEDFEFTREERKVLAAFAALLDRMRSAPPAKEPVSVEGVLETCRFDGKPLGLWVRIPYDRQDNGDYDHGDRVRVVKIEETT